MPFLLKIIVYTVTVYKTNETSRKFIEIKNSCFVPINKVITITLV